MPFLLKATVLLAVIGALLLTRVFRRALASSNPRLRRVSEFLRTFLLWTLLTPALAIFFALAGAGFSASGFLMAACCLIPGLVMGALGASIMTLVVRPGRRVSAVAVGASLGFGIPLAFFLALVEFLPKNEATLGYGLAGPLFALPSGIAGIVAGIWRSQLPPSQALM